MTDCPACHRPMREADTCAVSHVIFADAARAERRHYAGETRCHDCGVSSGGFHHPFCEVEECPRCGGPLVSCPCKTQYVPAIYTSELPFKVEAWSKDGQRIDRLLATATNIGIARGAYDAAVGLFTGERITLRQGERVVSETKARG
jgi:hypothetical protein